MKKYLNIFSIIPISLGLSWVIIIILTSLMDNRTNNYGMYYLAWPFLFALILVVLFYIHSRLDASNKSKAGHSIVVDVLGMSCGFLVAFFTIIGILSFLFPQGTEIGDGFPLVIILYFTFMIYGGFRLSHYIYSTLQNK